MSIVAIRTAIKSKLDSLSGDGNPLQDVRDEHCTGFNGYPAVTFEPSDVLNDFETNVENMRRYVFRIVVHQETEKVTRSEALDILCGVVDTLMDEFDKDSSLSGVAIMSKAVPSVWGSYSEGAGVVLYSELKLEVLKPFSVI